jgi:hypothetical protein
MRPDRCIDCFFNSPEGRLPCVLLAEAVEMMADGRNPETAWRVITRNWSDTLASIAEKKHARHPQEPIVIGAGDLKTATQH